jgi:blue copper oxidase
MDQRSDDERVHAHHDSATTRRRFLRTAGATGVVALGGVAFSDVARAKKGGGGGGGGGGATSGNLYPLRIPPQRVAGSGRLSLHAVPGQVDIGGMTANALTYDGLLPGPTFVASKGSTASIDVTNGLTAPTTVHWHGLIVPTAVDGQPHEAFGPGATQAYDLPIIQRAGLNFYHPHPHLQTASQVALGLAGAFIIRDDEEAALNLPSGKYEVPLIIRDAEVSSSGDFTYNGTASGFTGSTALVNGTRSPYLVCDRAVYRLRILNGANSRVFRLELSNGTPLRLIGNDGGLLEAAADVSQIELSNAERLDVLVDLRAVSGSVFLRDASSGWNLLELRVPPTAPTVPFAGLPSRLSTIERLGSPVRTRDFSFDGMTKINGQVYDMSRISFVARPGEVERWTFRTKGNAPHPVHVHGASFQVESRSGGRGRLFEWEQGWKDTVLLNNKESVSVLVRFDIEGRYLMHCHKLEHEDAGMMLNFVVGDPAATAHLNTSSSATADSTEQAEHHGH